MMNLLPHHRFHIPNILAIFAALLLLVTSVTGFESEQEGYASSQETISSANVECADTDYANEAMEQKSSGLNLGLLLFRR